MKIIRFTNTEKTKTIMEVLFASMLVLFALMSTTPVSANGGDCTMICNSNLIVPLPKDDCKTWVTFDDLLPNPCYQDGYLIEILNNYNEVVYSGTNSVEVKTPGKFKHKVTHTLNGKTISCWGYITFEDKEAPVKRLSLDPDTDLEVCGRTVLRDPSGIDDLKPEIVSCFVKDKFGEEALEPWFDQLEKDDFFDCTGVKEVYNFTKKFDLCKRLPLPNWVSDQMEVTRPNFPQGWEPTHVYVRSWFASDHYGRLSDTCKQLVVVVRPKAFKIRIDNVVKAECGDDEEIIKKRTYPYFFDLRNGPDFVTCPSFPANTTRRVIIEPGTHFCKYSASKHEDPITPLCGTDGSDVYKKVTHWTVTDWCTGKIIRGNGRIVDGVWKTDLFDEFTTHLEVYDSEKPILSGQPTIDTHTSLFDCFGDVEVGPITIEDCTGGVEFKTIAEYVENEYDPHYAKLVRKESPTNGISLTEVPLGTMVTLTYIVTDACGNTSKTQRRFNVEDDRPPVCITNDVLNVGMVRIEGNPKDLATRVYGEDLDDTSRDNCHPLIFEVRRSDQAEVSDDPDALWAKYVEFTEEDLTDGGCKGEYKVELRVTEDVYGERGLSSTCWATVVLEDKNPPMATIGDNKVARCTEERPEFDELQIMGCYDGIDENVHTLFENECSDEDDRIFLELEKTWRPYRLHEGHKQYFDAVSQRITIFDNPDSKFTFPTDIKMDCAVASVPDPVKLEDILDEKGCSNWLMEVEDKEFQTSDPDACRKILRKYTFLNWCTWDPSNTELASVRRPANGVWSEDDRVILHYKDYNLDNVNDIDDKDDGDAYDIETSQGPFETDGAWVQIDKGDKVQGQEVYDHTEEINGREVTSLDGFLYGYFSYTQVIKIQDNEDPFVEVELIKIECEPTDTDCEFPRKLTARINAGDNCSELDVTSYFQENQTGDAVLDEFGTITLTNDFQVILEGYYPIGIHNIIVRVEDACSNYSEDTLAIEILEECKKPTPICYATFTAAMENGTVEIWASDVESGSSSDNCSDYEDLTFTIELVTDRNNDGYITAADVPGPAPSETAVLLTCENVGKSFVALWAIDTSGNEQFCLAPVILVDNDGYCTPLEAQVSGKIVNEEDEDIDQVTVKVEGNGFSDLSSVFNGSFDFTSVPMHRDVTIKPSKDLGYLNGVSTSDLVLLQRHILGVSSLNSPYKIIAADANADDNVDTRDMLHMSRLILGVYNELPSNTSWRFVAADHIFTNPTAPWGFPEAVEYADLDQDRQSDFIGVKIGDISGNAAPSNLVGSVDPFSTGEVQFSVKSQILEAGAQEAITFLAKDFNDISGYQFTIELNNDVEFHSIDYGSNSELSEVNFGLSMIDENIITVSWSKAHAVDFKDGEAMFTLNVTAFENVKVEETVRLNSAFTPAEAYDNDLNHKDISLNFIQENNEFELFQNIPNPVTNETIIGFNLPDAGNVSLRVMDVSGRVLKSIQGEYAKGYNQVTINRSDLGATGVLYYQLDAPNNSASKKMIIIK